MRAVSKLFAVFCLTILLGAAQISAVFAQEPVKPSTENSGTTKTESNAKNETVAATTTPTGTKRNDDRYRIGYQDTLEVSVAKHSDFGGTFSVQPDGTIRLPRLTEPVVAVCKTERELADEITERHKTILRNPFVNVRAVTQYSQQVAVIGAVEKPGNFYLNRKVRLLELLSFAGGPDSEKAGTKLILARTGSSTVCREKGEEIAGGNGNTPELILYQYKIRDVLEGKENVWVQPGDIVSVLDFDMVYVYGNVNKQGSVKLKQPLTLRQAIIEAEGFKPASKKDKIRILRQKPDGLDWDTLTFDLKDIDSGKVTDPFLMPNDIVAVSEDSTKKIINGFVDTLKNGLPSLFYRVP